MKQILLLVQSQADVDALPAASAAIKTAGYQGLWMLFSPAVLVDSKAAEAEHEQNLSALRTAIQRCKDADDFDGAKGYKAQLDAALLDRAAKVKDSWKQLTDQQRETAIARVFGQFFDSKPAPNVRPEMFRDHYEPAQFIDALNSVRKGWFAPYVPGSFTLAWAASFAGNDAVTASLPVNKTSALGPIVPVTPPKPTEPPKERKPLPTQHPRFKQLRSLGVDGLGRHAIEMGLNPNGKSQLALTHEVFKKEMESGKITA